MTSTITNPCGVCRGSGRDHGRCYYCAGTGRKHVRCEACAVLSWRDARSCSVCRGVGRLDIVRDAAAIAAQAAAPARAPLTPAEAATLRSCDGCGHPTKAPRLCPTCEHEEHEMRRTDEAFNARVRGQRRPKHPAKVKREDAARATEHRRRAAEQRAPIEHRRAAAAVLAPQAEPGETRLERDDDAERSAREAWERAEGSQAA